MTRSSTEPGRATDVAIAVFALNRMLEQGRSTVRLEDVDAAAEAALTVEDTQLESEPSALERPAMAD